MLNFFVAVKFLFHSGNSIWQGKATFIKNLISLFQLPANRHGNSSTGNAYAVKACHDGWVASNDDKRRYILVDSAHAAAHAVAANLGELVHSRETADDGAVFDNDVTGQGRHVAHDDVVADNAVMGNMGIGHHQDIVADARFIAFPDSAMNRSTFADGHMVTNNGRRIFPFIFKVLGHFPNAGPLEEFSAFSDGRTPRNDDMRMNDGPFPNLDIRSND